MEEPFDIKRDLSLQMIKNAKELTQNFIYPLDYKLNNMMYVNGEVKFIDLDDRLTKVRYGPDYLANRRSISDLGETVEAFFRDTNYGVSMSKNVRTCLGKEPRFYGSYDDILDYIKEKSFGSSYLLVDNNSDLNEVESLSKYRDNKIVIKYCKDY